MNPPRSPSSNTRCKADGGRGAAQLLENFLKRDGAAPAGPELSALRVKLQPEG